MRITSSVVLILAGMLAGMALVLSCGDDSPGKADAALCDCPAAEPPIAGRLARITRIETIAPNDFGAASAGCPDGGQLISGSCTNITSAGADLTLQQSGFVYDDARGWECWFKNNAITPVTVKVTAICLVPGP